MGESSLRRVQYAVMQWVMETFPVRFTSVFPSSGPTWHSRKMAQECVILKLVADDVKDFASEEVQYYP